MRLLLCEDDDQLARGLSRALRRAGHRVERAIGTADAFRRIRTEPPDLALVDLTLPDGHGSQVVQRLREHSHIGIIVITAHGDERSRVLGLRAGADDYVVKPFSLAELMARIDAVDRRTRPLRQSPAPTKIMCAGYALDTTSRLLHGSGEPVSLTGKESAILALLMAAPGAAVPRERFVEEIWPGSPASASRSLDTHIGALRAKLPEALAIATVRGVGYRLNPPGGEPG